MRRRSDRSTAFIARPLRGSVVSLLVVLAGVLLVSIFGLVAVSQGVQELRSDRERLGTVLYLAGALGETDAPGLARMADAYLDNSVLRRIVPVEPEPAAIFDHLDELTDQVRAGAASVARADAIWHELWALYRWYGPYLEAHASTYERFLGFFAFGVAVAVSAAVASQSAIRRVESHRRRAQELARNRIALFELEHRSLMMELHDSVGQQLAAAQLRVSLIDDPAAIECARMLDASRDAIRNLARRLHPAELDQIGLPSAIRQLCDDVVLAGGVACELDLEEDVDDYVEPANRIQVYRIIQEAVTNAMKHSAASAVSISMKHAADSVWLAIRDDGVGFEHTGRRPTRGFGIMSMTERANMLDGTLAVVSRPGTGTLVSLQIPARRKRRDVSSTSIAVGR